MVKTPSFENCMRHNRDTESTAIDDRRTPGCERLPTEVQHAVASSDVSSRWLLFPWKRAFSRHGDDPNRASSSPLILVSISPVLTLEKMRVRYYRQEWFSANCEGLHTEGSTPWGDLPLSRPRLSLSMKTGGVWPGTSPGERELSSISFKNPTGFIAISRVPCQGNTDGIIP